MNYIFSYRNNASNKANTFIASGVQYQELYITLEVGDRLKDEPDGEYTYVIAPYSGDTPTMEYKGNLLDSVINESITLRDLKPATGIFRIGDIGVTNTYEKENNKTFYYEG